MLRERAKARLSTWLRKICNLFQQITIFAKPDTCIRFLFFIPFLPLLYNKKGILK